jgi:hypothetical protein
VHDGTQIERRGVPAVVFCTEPFRAPGDAMAARQGLPGYRYILVRHPLSSLTEAEVRERAAAALPDLLAILGLPAQSGIAAN